jgi:hypothetical protein
VHPWDQAFPKDRPTAEVHLHAEHQRGTGQIDVVANLMIPGRPQVIYVPRQIVDLRMKKQTPCFQDQHAFTMSISQRIRQYTATHPGTNDDDVV